MESGEPKEPRAGGKGESCVLGGAKRRMPGLTRGGRERCLLPRKKLGWGEYKEVSRWAARASPGRERLLDRLLSDVDPGGRTAGGLGSDRPARWGRTQSAGVWCRQISWRYRSERCPGLLWGK